MPRLLDQVVATQCRLDSVVCVVDAVHIIDQLEVGTDAADQIVFADHLILNKVDDASQLVDRIEVRLRTINPFARITRTNRADVPTDDILDSRSFELERLEERFSDMEFLDGHSHHVGDDGISSVSLVTEAPLDAVLLEAWLQELLARRGGDLLRIKGILSVAGEDRKRVLQAVNMMLEGD